MREQGLEAFRFLDLVSDGLGIVKNRVEENKANIMEIRFVM